MEALHTVEKIERSISGLETNIQGLQDYMAEIKARKSDISFEAHEQAVSKYVYAIGQAALSEALSYYDVTTEVISVGEQTYRRSYQAKKEYQTAFGGVQVERTMYNNRKSDGDGHCICPLELQVGMIGGYWTPLAAKHAIWSLSHLTPQETEDMMLHFGMMNPSRSSLDRLPKILNEHWEAEVIEYHEALMAEERIPKDATTVAISLDGVMIGMKPDKSAESKATEWREASCGTISFFDKNGERLSTIQYGRFPEHKKATLKELLLKNTEAILQERPDLTLVHLADGAQDNWTFFDEQMPLGFQLTDFYHACEYLKSAFDAAYPDDKSKARAQFEAYKLTLRDDENGVQKTLRALRYLRSQNKNSKAIAASVTYFTNNQHRMKYAQAKQKQLPIGSGIVEAACKTLVGQRLKRAGMSWTINGGQAILTFRSIIKSQRFDKAWELVAKKYRKKVTVHAQIAKLVVNNLN